jgi:hypothetical protein
MLSTWRRKKSRLHGDIELMLSGIRLEFELSLRYDARNTGLNWRANGERAIWNILKPKCEGLNLKSKNHER